MSEMACSLKLVPLVRGDAFLSEADAEAAASAKPKLAQILAMRQEDRKMSRKS